MHFFFPLNKFRVSFEPNLFISTKDYDVIGSLSHYQSINDIYFYFVCKTLVSWTSQTLNEQLSKSLSSLFNLEETPQRDWSNGHANPKDVQELEDLYGGV